MDQPIEGLELTCPDHGTHQWQGTVFCKGCLAIYICTGTVEEEDGKKKHVYPDAPPKGVCSCGKRLFGGTDFTARPMCHECAVRVTTRRAAEKAFENVSASEVVTKIVAWLRSGKVSGPSSHSEVIADAIERGDWMVKP